MPRKLTINWVMPCPNMSGGTKSNRLIAEAMQRRGHDIVMYHPRRRVPRPSIRQPRRYLFVLKKRLAGLGKQQHQLETSAVPIVATKERAVRAHDVRDADVTIATWWETREWIETWPKSKGLKAYFVRHHELHGGDPERVAATYRLPGLKLVIAKWLRRVMADTYGDPDSVLVPNGVIRSQFDSSSRDKQPRPTVGFVYAGQEWKAADYAVESIIQAQRAMPELNVVCFGSTQIPKPLEARIGNFKFEFRPSQERLADLYSSADMWLLPSDSEGFGMPGVEAAACHCPIIATRCGGPEDYVEHGRTGYLVDVRDQKAMTDAILRIARMPNDKWRQMSEASYKISLGFDWDRSAELLETALITSVDGDYSSHAPDDNESAVIR